MRDHLFSLFVYHALRNLHFGILDHLLNHLLLELSLSLILSALLDLLLYVRLVLLKGIELGIRSR